MPTRKTVTRSGEAIAADPDGWAEATAAAFIDLGLGGESLKRVPPGFDKDHPYADDLRRKDFAAFAALSEKEATTPGFLDRYEARLPVVHAADALPLPRGRRPVLARSRAR